MNLMTICVLSNFLTLPSTMRKNLSLASTVKYFFTLLFIFIFSLQSYSQRQIPEQGGVWVRDEANVLSPGVAGQLEAALKAHRDSTSNQIAVYIIPSLDGDDIDSYANRVFNAWKLGKADKDNGALFLISITDKLMRIEVGQGLEGVLTDAQSSRINRNQVAPRFRVGDYDGGVVQGVGAIIQTIAGTYVNEEPPQQQRRSSKRSPLTTIIVLIIIFLIARRRGGGGGGGGGYMARGLMGGMMMGGFGRSSGSWGGGGGGDFGGGGFSGGGGSSDSW
jgi:uncharacterized protein